MTSDQGRPFRHRLRPHRSADGPLQASRLRQRSIVATGDLETPLAGSWTRTRSPSRSRMLACRSHSAVKRRSSCSRAGGTSWASSRNIPPASTAPSWAVSPVAMTRARPAGLLHRSWQVGWLASSRTSTSSDAAGRAAELAGAFGLAEEPGDVVAFGQALVRQNPPGQCLPATRFRTFSRWEMVGRVGLEPTTGGL